jgi:deoxyribodipyrimidine photolyase-related protein
VFEAVVAEPKVQATSPYVKRVRSSQVDSVHFYSQHHEAAALFAQLKQWLMETFCRHMRKHHRVLIDGPDKPAGGQWNFDADNRKP